VSTRDDVLALAPTETDNVADWPRTPPFCFHVHDPTTAAVQLAVSVTMPPPVGRVDGLAIAEHEGAATGVGTGGVAPACVRVALDVEQADGSSAAQALS
jgi:hypothetical protein